MLSAGKKNGLRHSLPLARHAGRAQQEKNREQPPRNRDAAQDSWKWYTPKEEHTILDTVSGKFITSGMKRVPTSGESIPFFQILFTLRSTHGGMAPDDVKYFFIYFMITVAAGKLHRLHCHEPGRAFALHGRKWPAYVEVHAEVPLNSVRGMYPFWPHVPAGESLSANKHAKPADQGHSYFTVLPRPWDCLAAFYHLSMRFQPEIGIRDNFLPLGDSSR